MSKIHIKNVSYIDHNNKRHGDSDLLIEGGIITQIAGHVPDQDRSQARSKDSLSADETPAKTKIIDGNGLVATPSFVDVHVHLREPGREDKENIITGTRAAAKGGYGAVFAMPNTDPIADSPQIVSYIRDKAEREAYVNVYPVAAITRGSKGDQLTDMQELLANGAIAFSDDGQPVMDASIMRNALRYAKMIGAIIIVHAEDKNIAGRGHINEGAVSDRLGICGIPSSAEEVMIARDLVLAAETGAKIHFAHISTQGSVEMIRLAKKSGVDVSCEVAPHHIALNETCILGDDAVYKVNPPLRTQKDVEALKAGLADGTIDMIATDHAPHTIGEKDQVLEVAPFGMIGLETAFSVCNTELVLGKVISFDELIYKMAIAPRERFGLPGITIQKGSPAEIVLVDPNKMIKVDASAFESKGRNCPFDKWELHGKVEHLIGGGTLRVENGEVKERPVGAYMHLGAYMPDGVHVSVGTQKPEEAHK